MSAVMPFALLSPTEVQDLGLPKGRYCRRTRDGVIVDSRGYPLQHQPGTLTMSVEHASPLDDPVIAETTPTIIEVDGYLVDADTGEVLDIVTPEPRFAVRDQASCEWVLNKFIQAEAEVAAVMQSAVVIHALAVLENADKLRKEKQRTLDWLRRRFTPELGEFARQELIGKKTKTLKTLLGAISLRTVKGGLRVKDKEIALHVAKEVYPGAIKTTEEFQISRLTSAEWEELVAGLAPNGWEEDDATRKAFELTTDEEKVDIKTGVGK